MSELVDSAAHVIVANIDLPILSDDDRHHLERVLRLRTGTVITVTDGRGSWRSARLGADLDEPGPVNHVAAPRPLVVACAITKGGKPELTVQKLTEIGVAEVVWFPAAHSVARWTADKTESQLSRLRRVADSAVGQCRRVWRPQISVAAALSDVLQRPGTAVAHMGGASIDSGTRCIVVGPEGGWSPSELAQSQQIVGLGSHVLRADTAALVAATLLCAAHSSAR